MKKVLNDKQLICLLIISILGCFSGAMLAPIEMPFVQSILHDTSKASFVFTVATIASVIGIFLVNSLANKYGNKKTLSIFMMLAIIFPFLYSNAISMLQVYGVKFSWIICTAGFAPIFESLFQNEVIKIKVKPGVFYGYLYSIQSLAGMLGSLAGGVVSDITGYKVVFYILALISFIQLFVFIYMTQSSNESELLTKKYLKDGDIFKGIKYIFGNTELRTRLVLSSSFSIAWGSKIILYPLIIMQITQLNTITGMVMSIQGMVAMIILPGIGKIVDVSGYRRVLLFGYILLAIALFMFGISSSLIVIYISAILIALAEACNGPAMGALEVKNIPEELRNSVNSFQQIYNIILNVIVTAGIGILLYVFSPQIVIKIISIIIFLAFVYALVVYRNNILSKND